MNPPTLDPVVAPTAGSDSLEMTVKGKSVTGGVTFKPHSNKHFTEQVQLHTLFLLGLIEVIDLLILSTCC